MCADTGAEEYCLPEVFHAECAVGEVVVMERARFGRMELGRCVTRNYGYIGCAVDVMATLDDACSGHRACDLSVSDPALVRTKPCPKDFAAYLDADYRCVQGKNPTRLFLSKCRGIVVCANTLPPSLSLRLTVIFQVNLGWPVFIEAKDDGGGGDN